MSDHARPRPLLIAHRACPLHTAENSLAGIRLADHFGADLVEFDVRGTREGERVLMHDRWTRRTAGGHLPLRRTQLARTRALRLRGRDGRATSEPPPLLREALAAAGSRMGVAVEVKDARVSAGTLADVREAGMTDRTLIWSYSEQVVSWFARHAPELEVSLLRDTRSARQHRRFVQDAAALGAGGLSISWSALNPALAAEVRARGLSLYSLSGSPRPDPATARLLDGLVTDWPLETRAFLSSPAAAHG